MKFLTQHKTLVGVVLVIVVAFAAYSIFLKDDSGGALLVAETTAGGSTTGAEILALLSQLRSLTLDSEIFDNEVFRSLSDFTVEIPQRPVGRQNPFAPL